MNMNGSFSKARCNSFIHYTFSLQILSILLFLRETCIPMGDTDSKEMKITDSGDEHVLLRKSVREDGESQTGSLDRLIRESLPERACRGRRAPYRWGGALH